MSISTEETKEREAALRKEWPERRKARITEQAAAKKKNKAIYDAGVVKAMEKAKAKRRRKG